MTKMWISTAHDPAPYISDTEWNAACDTADADSKAAETVRDALVECLAKIQDIEFATGYPVRGYDFPDVLALLKEVTPECNQVEYDKYSEAALGIVRIAG